MYVLPPLNIPPFLLFDYVRSLAKINSIWSRRYIYDANIEYWTCKKGYDENAEVDALIKSEGKTIKKKCNKTIHHEMEKIRTTYNLVEVMVEMPFIEKNPDFSKLEGFQNFDIHKFNKYYEKPLLLGPDIELLLCEAAIIWDRSRHVGRRKKLLNISKIIESKYSGIFLPASKYSYVYEECDSTKECAKIDSCHFSIFNYVPVKKVDNKTKYLLEWGGDVLEKYRKINYYLEFVRAIKSITKYYTSFLKLDKVASNEMFIMNLCYWTAICVDDLEAFPNWKIWFDACSGLWLSRKAATNWKAPKKIVRISKGKIKKQNIMLNPNLENKDIKAVRMACINVKIQNILSLLKDIYEVLNREKRDLLFDIHQLYAQCCIYLKCDFSERMLKDTINNVVNKRIKVTDNQYEMCVDINNRLIRKKSKKQDRVAWHDLYSKEEWLTLKPRMIRNEHPELSSSQIKKYRILLKKNM